MEDKTKTDKNSNVTSKEVPTITSTELAATSFENFKSMNDILAFGEIICQSKLSPLKTPGDVAAALLMGKELGLSPMISINNIYPIEGKASSGIHIIAAQLLKIGISYEVISEYEPVFEIAIKGDPNPVDGKPTFVRVKRSPYSEPLKEGEFRGKTITDYVTIIKFKRKLKQPDGTYIPMEIISKFYYSEIPESLLKKTNWQNYLTVMMYTRCFTNGAKKIGDDVLLGLSELSEMADATNTPYEYKPDGTITILDKKDQIAKEESAVEDATIED